MTFDRTAFTYSGSISAPRAERIPFSGDFPISSTEQVGSRVISRPSNIFYLSEAVYVFVFGEYIYRQSECFQREIRPRKMHTYTFLVFTLVAAIVVADSDHHRIRRAS
jgi:hypothetical protein